MKRSLILTSIVFFLLGIFSGISITPDMSGWREIIPFFSYGNIYKKYSKSPYYVKEYKLFSFRFKETISAWIEFGDMDQSSGAKPIIMLGLKEKLYYFVLRNSRDMIRNWLNEPIYGGNEEWEEIVQDVKGNSVNKSDEIVKKYIKAVGNKEFVKSFFLRCSFSEKHLWFYMMLAYKGLGNKSLEKRLKDMMFKYTPIEGVEGFRKYFKYLINGCENSLKEPKKRKKIENSSPWGKFSEEYFNDMEDFYRDFLPDYIKIYSEILKELDEVEREYYKKCN